MLDVVQFFAHLILTVLALRNKIVEDSFREVGWLLHLFFLAKPVLQIILAQETAFCKLCKLFINHGLFYLAAVEVSSLHPV